mmetsp:Transcript_18187/g.27980  ORF Transcript_18187/g.27980 Transcript_18187/m.27980 type:complete len:129 (-) Transcript_18187:1608-1994(-)
MGSDRINTMSLEESIDPAQNTIINPTYIENMAGGVEEAKQSDDLEKPVIFDQTIKIHHESTNQPAPVDEEELTMNRIERLYRKTNLKHIKTGVEIVVSPSPPKSNKRLHSKNTNEALLITREMSEEPH